jgi:hypothetical protein
MTLKSITRSLAVVAGCLLFASPAANAISINFASAGNATISFTGTGDTFTFNDSTLAGASLGRDFVINNSSGSGATGSSAGLYGNISGTYQIGAITVNGAAQAAAVTLASAVASNVFSISDGTFTLLAFVNWLTIKTEGTSGTLNQAGGTLSLTGITYSGSNADLIALKNSSLGNGIATVSFQFVDPQHTLTTLTADGAVNATSYSGSVTSVPDGGATAAFLGLGLLGVGLLSRRMKFAMA